MQTTDYLKDLGQNWKTTDVRLFLMTEVSELFNPFTKSTRTTWSTLPVERLWLLRNLTLLLISETLHFMLSLSDTAAAFFKRIHPYVMGLFWHQFSANFDVCFSFCQSRWHPPPSISTWMPRQWCECVWYRSDFLFYYYLVSVLGKMKPLCLMPVSHSTVFGHLSPWIVMATVDSLLMLPLSVK